MSLKRFYEYGFPVGVLSPGDKNSIADVEGVYVGHVTKIEEEGIRTGVTIVDPAKGNKKLFFEKLPAAIAVGNGFGKLTGITQVAELGTLEAPLALTNTLAVGPVLRGMIDVVLASNPDILPGTTVNVVVGETNDGFLNNIHKDLVTKDDVQSAYNACDQDFPLGNVGGGAGTRAFSWKGGIGTSSRVVRLGGSRYVVGALLQTNFGGSLVILGVPIGQLLGKTDFDEMFRAGDGSCVIVLATDAPLTARQLQRIARRAFFGLARTGSVMSHGSGDYAIAFSTNRSGIEGSGTIGKCINEDDLTKFFLAAVEAVEEGVYDALFAAETMHGRDGNILEALPKEEVLALLQKNLSR